MRNEAPNVDPLYRATTEALTGYGRSYEIIAIDDGSTDETFRALASLQASDPRLRVIRFRRNFGQTAAFSAGFAHARGRFIVTLDGDVQNDPRDIPTMIDLAERREADIVAGWRRKRKDPFLNRRLPSLVANWIISFATGVKLHDYGCSLKVFRAEVVRPMKLYGEMHRFLPAIASEQGVSIVECEVNHYQRKHGNSKYGIGRTIRVILDLLTVKFLLSYSTRPLQIFGLVGGGMGARGAGHSRLARRHPAARDVRRDRRSIDRQPPAAVLWHYAGAGRNVLGDDRPPGRMLARTYHESQNKPIYAIRGDSRGESEPEQERETVRW